MNTIFSFIIISYNRAQDTIDAVKNVLGLYKVDGWQKEIIVLNNASTTDYSIFESYLNQLSAEEKYIINYINSDTNLGVAGGRNLCIKKATGKYLLFMDDDAEITNQDVIQKVLNLYDKYQHQRLAIIGFLGKNPYTGKTETPLKNPNLIKDKNEIFYNLFFGYGHVFPKSLIDETGFYQDDFFYGMEEYDLSYATIKNGYSILFTKEILVLHKQNPDGREPSKSTYARMFENKLIVVYKHLPNLYILTHFVMWSVFLIWKSKFDLSLYFKSLKKLNQRIKHATRLKMNINGMQYLKNVGARLWY